MNAAVLGCRDGGPAAGPKNRGRRQEVRSRGTCCASSRLKSGASCSPSVFMLLLVMLQASWGSAWRITNTGGRAIPGAQREVQPDPGFPGAGTAHPAPCLRLGAPPLALPGGTNWRQRYRHRVLHTLQQDLHLLAGKRRAHPTSESGEQGCLL